jgi:hypothetical protein
MLFLDGVYLIDGEPPVFRRLPAPRPQALEALIHTISQRVGAFLEREALLVRDIENSYLQLDAPDESAMSDLLGHSITYRMAAERGRRTLQLIRKAAQYCQPVGDDRFCRQIERKYGLRIGYTKRGRPAKRAD